MNLASVAQQRYSTKAYDADRRIPQSEIDDLLTGLRYCPSSVNTQPWHFVVASNAEGKARIADTLQGSYAYNVPKVLHASHVIVFCVREDLSAEYLQQLLEQEARDGRFRDAEAKEMQNKARTMYVELHRRQQDLAPWMEKQVYLAVGGLLLGAALKGLDATPMEGIDPAAIDAALALPQQGYRCLLLVSLGYHSAQDFNAALPKSRLPAETVISML